MNASSKHTLPVHNLGLCSVHSLEMEHETELMCIFLLVFGPSRFSLDSVWFEYSERSGSLFPLLWFYMLCYVYTRLLGTIFTCELE